MVSRWLRPLAAVGAAGALLVAVPVTVAGRAASAPRLRPLPADRLVASVAAALAAAPPLQGELTAHVDLGLPSLELPGVGADRFASFFGDHRLRVWSSPDGHKLADLLPAAERSLVAGRDGAWAWDSSTFTAWRLADGPTARAADPSGLLDLADPLALARRSLAAIQPSTAVSVAAGARVAGRPAYVLRLVPRTGATLVGRVEVAVDAARRVPLRVAVYARGAAKPSVQAAFTRVRFGPVDPATFTFRPPPGATVRRPRLPEDRPEHRGRAPEYRPRTFGTGWATVVALPLPSSARPGPELTALLPFSGPLFSARLAVRGDDRWLLYGAVPQAALAAAEAKLPS
jgi:outer membrane lipoprotein-sorting protein